VGSRSWGSRSWGSRSWGSRSEVYRKWRGSVESTESNTGGERQNIRVLSVRTLWMYPYDDDDDDDDDNNNICRWLTSKLHSTGFRNTRIHQFKGHRLFKSTWSTYLSLDYSAKRQTAFLFQCLLSTILRFNAACFNGSFCFSNAGLDS